MHVCLRAQIQYAFVTSKKKKQQQKKESKVQFKHVSENFYKAKHFFL